LSFQHSEAEAGGLEASLGYIEILSPKTKRRRKNSGLINNMSNNA
jgi:hypothetical protein